MFYLSEAKIIVWRRFCFTILSTECMNNVFEMSCVYEQEGCIIAYPLHLFYYNSVHFNFCLIKIIVHEFFKFIQWNKMTSLYKTCFSIHTEYLLYWIVCSLPLWSLISSSKGWLAYHVGCLWTLYTSCWEKKPAKYKIHRLDVSTNMLVEAEKTGQNCILKKVPQKWVKNIYLLPIDSKTQLNNCCHMCLYRQVNVIWLSIESLICFPL